MNQSTKVKSLRGGLVEGSSLCPSNDPHMMNNLDYMKKMWSVIIVTINDNKKDSAVC